MSKRLLRKDAGIFPEKVKVGRNRPSLTIETICPDFQEWPDSRDLDSEEECRSFDATCRKLYKYLMEEKARPS
jgi:hypothetical protein